MEGLGLKYVFGRQLKGWLRQHMGMMRGWQRRFFMLDSGRLSCLTREEDVVAIKTYVLKDCELKELPKSADSSFELTDKVTGESVVFRAANEEERKEWVKALRYTIYGDTGGGVFGVPLEVLMAYESKEGRSVPYIVEACVNHLKLYGKDTEGIFRMPGRTGLMKELREKFETGYRPVMDTVDVNTVASLLKAYLRDLPESLVPPSFYQKAMNFALRYSEAQSDAELQAKELTGLSVLLKELPSANYATLAYICQFLHDLSSISAVTKMDSHNLSIMFGPNLIRHLDDNPQLMMVTSDLTQQLAYMLIHHCPSLFTAIQEATQSGAAEDSPVALRKKKSQDKKSHESIPTADLLHLSTMSDIQTNMATLAANPPALGDLLGVDFSQQQDDVFNDQFEACSLGTADRREGSASSEASGGVGCVNADAANGSRVGSKPIPPRRMKSKMLRRNQQQSLGSSSSEPDVSQNAGTSPTTAKTFQQSSGKDDAPATALWGAVATTENQTQERQITSAAVCHSATNRGLTEEFTNSEEFLLQTGGCSKDPAALDKCLAHGVDTITLGSSRTSLEAQVSALKTELVSVKSQYDCQVSSLKSELNSVRSMFEERIAAMELQHAIYMKDLSTRLAAEAKARAEAVDQTVGLQAELYRYKLQYGELQGSK